MDNSVAEDAGIGGARIASSSFVSTKKGLSGMWCSIFAWLFRASSYSLAAVRAGITGKSRGLIPNLRSLPEFWQEVA